MENDDSNLMDEVQTYRKIVLQYEELDEKIDALLMKHGGATEAMSAEELAHYRELAHLRDELYNQMRFMEQTLLNNDENQQE